jgi:hypothetical protein
MTRDGPKDGVIKANYGSDIKLAIRIISVKLLRLLKPRQVIATIAI